MPGWPCCANDGNRILMTSLEDRLGRSPLDQASYHQGLCRRGQLSDRQCPSALVAYGYGPYVARPANSGPTDRHLIRSGPGCFFRWLWWARDTCRSYRPDAQGSE